MHSRRREPEQPGLIFRIQKRSGTHTSGTDQRGFLPGDSRARTRAAQLPCRRLALISRAGDPVIRGGWFSLAPKPLC